MIVDMHAPGVEVRPLRQITGEAEFNEIFFTNVEVPRENLVGELNGGWRITVGSLAHERGGLWTQTVAGIDYALTCLIEEAKRNGQDDNTAVRRRLADAHAQVSSLRSLGYKGFTSFAQGSAAPEHSYLKLAASEVQKSFYELGMQLQGPGGAVLDSNGTAKDPIRLTLSDTLPEAAGIAALDEGGRPAHPVVPPPPTPWYKRWGIIGTVAGVLVVGSVLALIATQQNSVSGDVVH